MITKSTRFKLTVFSTVLLIINGILAYIYDPIHIDKLSVYTINLALPIVSYIAGRTIRSGTHTQGLIQRGSRYKLAFAYFIISLIIGNLCYLFSPENIDKLGMYMIGVVSPVIGYIIGRSFKKTNEESNDEPNYNEP